MARLALLLQVNTARARMLVCLLLELANFGGNSLQVFGVLIEILLDIWLGQLKKCFLRAASTTHPDLKAVEAPLTLQQLLMSWSTSTTMSSSRQCAGQN